MSNVSAAEHCSDEFYINETLPNGARWDMCWEHRQREGIIYHHIYYTPKEQPRRLILNQASIAQIHVPYDDNGTRFHDISDYGIGGYNLLGLTPSECLNGKLLTFIKKKVICQQIEERGFAYKKAENTTMGHTLALFSVSPVSAYHYIPLWRFMDNGTIEPWLGATGALQRFGTDVSHGSTLGDGRVGISHLHNFFWKLDFDLNGTPENDIVEEINFPIIDGQRNRTTTIFENEASRKVNPESMRRWRIKDGDSKNEHGHAISYDILLAETGHQDIGPASEPFTHNDIYVTKQKDEEKFASHNSSGGKNLAEFANNEKITGQDIVVWAGITFYHVPRSEDAPHMDAHWSHFKLVPRDWHTSNPLGRSTTFNNPPVISAIENKTSKVGDIINLSVKANDADEDKLSYTSNHLPAGLTINKQTGLITGTLTSATNDTVQIIVSDNESSSNTDFTWTVEVVHINHPPELINTEDQSGLIGDTVQLSIKASDADEDDLIYSASGLPPGLSIEATTGVISGSLTTAGNFLSTLTASDDSSDDTQQVIWTVIPPLSNQISDTAIIVDGELPDWSTRTFFPNDPADATDKKSQIDWIKVAIAHTPSTIYLAYQNKKNIDPTQLSGNYIPNGWQAYLDTDNNSETGYAIGQIGADYLIEGTHIQRYIGTNTSWAWEPKGLATLAYKGAASEISFKRSTIHNPEKLRVVFVGNNHLFGSSQKDIYPDTGFFNYSFTGNSASNTTPIAHEQNITVESGDSISIILSASDSDGDSLSYRRTSQPKHGSLSGSAPNLIYTANPNFTGEDSFTFKANDSSADSLETTITINVTSKQTGLTLSNYSNTAITLDGNPTDWTQLTPYPDDINSENDNPETGIINWKNVTLAHTNEKLYLLINSQNNINPTHNQGSYLPWGWQAFIDTDKNKITGFSTGDIGADFIIEGSRLLQYIGTGNDWSWKYVDQAQVQYNGKIAELALARTTIGNPATISILFRGDSQAHQLSGVDLYPNSQNSVDTTTRHFQYDFKGNDGVNAIPEAFAQTVAVNTGAKVIINLITTAHSHNHLTYIIENQPMNGELTGTAPNLIYKPETDFIGQDSFRFKVNGGDRDSILATVTIHVTGAKNGIYSNSVNSITVDGHDEDWNALTPFTQDTDTSSNENNVIDWKRATAAHNDTNIYILYKNHGLINSNKNTGDYVNSGWKVFLDTDEDALTGYKIGNIGADFLIEGQQLLEYTGAQSSWSWKLKEKVPLHFNTDTVELSITRSLLKNPDKIKIFFRGDNSNFNGSVDNYPNNEKSFLYLLEDEETGLENNSQRPISNSFSIDVSSNSEKDINLSSSKQEIETLTYRITHPPKHGKIVKQISNTIYTYIPNTDYSGEDRFSYIINDATYDSSIATVSLTILKNLDPVLTEPTPAPLDTPQENPNPSNTNKGSGVFPLELIMILWLVGKRLAIPHPKAIAHPYP